VPEEEKPGTGIFAKAKEGGIATPELAKRLAERTQELMEEANAGALGPPETRSFRVRTNAGMKPASQEHNMARGSSSTTERERDEHGRFASDDDQFDIEQAIVGGISAALASQAGKPKGGCERDGCGDKKDFVAFLFIHHNVLEAL
jgi:hypothetical protein